MGQFLRNMSEEELLERLARLTDHLASCRGRDASYDFCIIDIQEVQDEIEDRKKQSGRGGSQPSARK